MRRVFGISFVLFLVLSACGDDTDSATTSAPETSTTSTTLATTTTPSTTPMTTTTTTTTAPTTTAPGSDLPTYSEVVATYPAGTELCTTQAGISGGGAGYSLGGFDGQSANIQIRNGETLFWCLGARYVVTGAMVDEDGEPIEVGALLTLDADYRFVEVSSFD